MALTKQAVPINFSQGLDTKTDPFQVETGKFLALQNTIFTKGGLLQKRNGYEQLTSLASSANYLTTLNGNLTALGNNIQAFNPGSSTWVTKGTYAPLELETLSLIRNNVNQIQCDTAVSANNLVCTVYSETNNSTTVYKYAIADSVTGQNIVSPTLIPVSSGVVTGSPRVFLLGELFVIVFTNVISTVNHLQYISINSNHPTIATANADVAALYVPSTTLSWDGIVANNNLYIAYPTTSGGTAVKITYLSAATAAGGGAPVAPTVFATYSAQLMSLCADVTIPQSPIIYLSWYTTYAGTGYIAAVDKNLNILPAFATPATLNSTGTIANLTSAAQNGVCTVYQEALNNYSYDSAIPTHYIESCLVTQAAVVGASFKVIRSVGLASKAFIINGVIYILAAFQSPYQPTYFLINGSTSIQASPQVIAKLAYENGGGYLTLGLPQVAVSSDIAQMPYLTKDFIEPLATLNQSNQLTTGGIYSQTGINLSTFTISTTNIDSVEIGENLNITGGFGWQYDGYLPVEQDFFLWPDSVEATWSASGGSIHAQPDGATNTNAYFYQVIYSWIDNQGLGYKSATSIPVSVTTTGSGTSGSITLNVPTLRLTYKISNPVNIRVFRWSVANQNYYEVSSSASQPNPALAQELNSTTVDSVAFVDTWADASIVGNSLIYTTGNVVEDINPPASSLMTLFDTRAWLVNAEDPNQLWFSKQVIEKTPVEWSDLFTVYIPPTTAAQGSTGQITAIAPMDDKLIIFKANAIYYIAGTGPDNTGNNNNYSQAIFITSTVGCSNQQSIVFTPAGLMFQSNKGTWLLARNLETTYIGAPVEEFNSSIIQSAVNVPSTNQVRFTLDSGQTLMYDYYYAQWGTFVGVPAISSCIFEGEHTFINQYGQVFQESPGIYLDGSNPVLMSFTTSWFNLAGLQGYLRAYHFLLLGVYYSPHFLNIGVAYDYNSSILNSVVITPTNFNSNVPSSGGIPVPFGGKANIEQWRVFMKKQRCQSFQITLNEVYDPSKGAPASAGLTLSGLNLVVALKKAWRPMAASQSAGTT